LTPAQAARDSDRFSLDIGIVNRLEIAVQDYFHKRKFDALSRKLLDSFLRFGGVDTHPKPFARLDHQHPEELDVDDRRAALSTYHIMQDKFEEDHWKVDFYGLLKGFMSSIIPNRHLDGSNDANIISTACKVLDNFYNFLLFHNVCPEPQHRDAILKCKSLLSNQVEEELEIMLVIPDLLPGRFSRACTYLWDIAYSLSDHPEAIDTRAFNSGTKVRDQKVIDVAKDIFIEGELSCHSDTVDHFRIEYIWQNPERWHFKVRMMLWVPAIVEIVGINCKPHNNKSVTSVGVAICRKWNMANNDDYDTPEGSVYRPEYMNKLPDRAVEFWIDNIGLCKLKKGMKLKGTAMLLDFDQTGQVWVLGRSVQALPSYYQICLNDLNAREAIRAPHLENAREYRYRDIENDAAPTTWDDLNLAPEHFTETELSEANVGN
jgi:hypothetical protein